jgi:hypothetical protein
MFVATCWKLSTLFISSRIKRTFFYIECIKHDLALVYGKVVISVFQCCNLLNTVHMFISSQIDSTAKIGHPECIKHDLELVYGKVVISVFQCCILLKTVHNVHLISNRQHSKNWTSRVHQTWFRACLWKSGYFCISMLHLAENCPQCSFNLEQTAQQKLDIQSASNMI